MANILTALSLVLGIWGMLPSQVFAQVQPLSFKAWKARQTNFAKDRVTQLKKQMNVERRLRGNIHEINKLQLSIRVSADNLLHVQNFTIEDYFNHYLIDFANRDQALMIAANKMSKREVAQLFRALLRSKAQGFEPEYKSPTLARWSREDRLSSNYQIKNK